MVMENVTDKPCQFYSFLDFLLRGNWCCLFWSCPHIVKTDDKLWKSVQFYNLNIAHLLMQQKHDWRVIIYICTEWRWEWELNMMNTHEIITNQYVVVVVSRDHLSCPRQKLTIVHGWAALPLARLVTSNEGIWRWGSRKKGRGSEESQTASLPWSSVCITLVRPANSGDSGLCFVKIW